jgi:predicted nuclease of restriction endonuclease-like (RecB) superfamily
VTNFATTLPAPQSELAQQLLKDPYKFDFLALGPEARERDLEQGLLAHVRQFLLTIPRQSRGISKREPLKAAD